MAQNVGATDSQIRTVAGALAGFGSLAVLEGALSLPTVVAPVLGLVAIMMLVTARVGTCPIYSVLSVNSCSRSSSPSR
jgi:hypothetical protein